MSFVVVEVCRGLVAPNVRVFGPYATPEEAEQARRRRHLDNMLSDAWWNPPKTYVAEIEAAR